jgi:hypothetical protein
MLTTLAHAGGLDELAIILFPVFVGLGVWLLTRQKNPPQRTPSVPPKPSENTLWSHPPITSDRGRS